MPRKKPKKPLIEAPPEPESSSGSSDSDPDISEHHHTPPSKKPDPLTQPRPTVAALPAQLKPKDSSKRPRKEKKHSFVGPGLGPGNGPEGRSPKKLFERVFSEDDEIVLLKGLVDFEGDPFKNDDDFCDFVKGFLHVEVSKVQIFDKVRRLRKKFYGNLKKKRKISNEHDKKVFELSKLVWNYDDGNGDDGDGDGNDNVGLKSRSKGLSGNGGDDGNDKNVGLKSSSKGLSGNGGNDSNDNVGLKSRSKGLSGDDGGGDNNVGLKSSSKGLSGNGDDNVGLKSRSKGVSGEGESRVFVKDKEVGDKGFKDVEIEVKEGIRVEAFRRMGAKQRDEIREMWRKVEIAQLKVDLMRCEARVEEKKRVLEALGLG